MIQCDEEEVEEIDSKIGSRRGKMVLLKWEAATSSIQYEGEFLKDYDENSNNGRGDLSRPK